MLRERRRLLPAFINFCICAQIDISTSLPNFCKPSLETIALLYPMCMVLHQKATNLYRIHLNWRPQSRKLTIMCIYV